MSKVADVLPSSLSGPVSEIADIAAPLAVLAAPFAVLNTILGPSLSHLACAPGNPDYPGCLIPGGSVERMVELGLSPAAAQRVATAAIAGQIGGGGGGRGSGSALQMR